MLGWGLVAALAILLPSTAQAQSQQLSLGIGYFSVRGEDARVTDDVLVTNLSSLAFDIGDFSGASVNGEWLVGITDYLEAGVGIGFYRRTVPSVYRNFVHEDGTEIAQDLKLRIVPITATVRFLPLGRGDAAVEPYVGAGIGIFNWRYSETGEFVDFFDDTVFRASFVGDGTAVGPVILGGVRVPVGEAFSIGGEVRYQRANGDLPLDQDFLTHKIDLGGITSQFTVNIRF
jgi:hypothetical protein